MSEESRSVVMEALDSMEDIVTLPEVTFKIIEVVDNSESNPDELYEVIKHDPALVAKVLRVVNSAFYGLPGQVANIKRAIALLGLAAIKNIAIAASMNTVFQHGEGKGSFSPKELWKHSMAVAVTSMRISDMLGQSFNRDEMFMIGLIHDLGLLIENQVFPEKLRKICEAAVMEQSSFLKLEQKIIGATHQDFGNALTLKWRFPHKLRDGISRHHTPDILAEETRQLGAILFCADTICCLEGLGFSLTASEQSLLPDMWEGIGLDIEQSDEIREGLQEEVEEAMSIFSVGN